MYLGMCLGPAFQFFTPWNSSHMGTSLLLLLRVEFSFLTLHPKRSDRERIWMSFPWCCSVSIDGLTGKLGGMRGVGGESSQVSNKNYFWLPPFSHSEILSHRSPHPAPRQPPIVDFNCVLPIAFWNWASSWEHFERPCELPGQHFQSLIITLHDGFT